MQIASLCDSAELDDDETLSALWAALLPDRGVWAAVAEPQRSARLCNAILAHLRQSPSQRAHVSPGPRHSNLSPAAPVRRPSALSGRLHKSWRPRRLRSPAMDSQLSLQHGDVTPSPVGAFSSVPFTTGAPGPTKAESMPSAAQSPAASEASAGHSSGALPRAPSRRLSRRPTGASSVRSAEHTTALARSSMRLAAKELHTVLETSVRDCAPELRDLSVNLSAYFDRGASTSWSQASSSRGVRTRGRGLESAASDTVLALPSMLERPKSLPAPPEAPAGAVQPAQAQERSRGVRSLRFQPESELPMQARDAHAASGATRLPRTSAPLVRHRSTQSTGCLGFMSGRSGRSCAFPFADESLPEAYAQEADQAQATVEHVSLPKQDAASSCGLDAVQQSGTQQLSSGCQDEATHKADECEEEASAAHVDGDLLRTVYALVRRVLDSARLGASHGST